VEIVVHPQADVPLDLMKQAVAIHDQAWPGLRPVGRQPGHDPALRPVSMLLVEDGRVLVTLDILSKSIVHRGQSYAASGLSAVVTDHAVQRNGFGKRLVEAARTEMGAGGADLAIFTCDTPLAPFYESAGFQVLAGTTVVGGTPARPFPSDVLNKVALACFYTSRAKAHAPDFVGARIPLYPGEIDRLW
jgi:aminoglycoside 2'-N-acetyltransferase I